MNDNTYIDLMSAAITNTDGTETEALTMFELQLLERNDPRLVWELFEPVRLTLLRRLYGMARHQIEQDHISEAQPSVVIQSKASSSGTAPEPDDTADSSAIAMPTQKYSQRSAVSPFTTQRRVASARNRSPRSARSAQDVLMTIGGRKSHLDYLTNHRGMPIGDLTYMGLANSHDEAPMFQRFAQRLMDSGIPKTGRAGDVVRRFITPDEADRMWLDLMKETAA
jgi:hypothetical protein